MTKISKIRAAMKVSALCGCLLMIGVSVGHAQELGGRPRARPDHITAGTAASAPANSGLPMASPDGLVLGGQTFRNANGARLPSMERMERYACPDRETTSYPSTHLCSKWPEARQSYEAAARATGIPAQVLICLTGMESEFLNGSRTVSSAGARGLTQFMPATARTSATTMTSNRAMQQAWSDYRSMGGTARGRDAYTSQAILSSGVQNSDVQIFATAWYLRNELRATESHWERAVGSTTQPNRNRIRNLIEYLLISYNAGGSRGRSYIRRGYDTRSLPRETRGYLTKYNRCIEEASRL
jgi:hypothetical protein